MSDKPSTVDKDATLARAAELVTREDAETRAALANPKRRRQMAAVLMWLLVVVNIVFWVVVPPPPQIGRAHV